MTWLWLFAWKRVCVLTYTRALTIIWIKQQGTTGCRLVLTHDEKSITFRRKEGGGGTAQVSFSSSFMNYCTGVSKYLWLLMLSVWWLRETMIIERIECLRDQHWSTWNCPDSHGLEICSQVMSFIKRSELGLWKQSRFRDVTCNENELLECLSASAHAQCIDCGGLADVICESDAGHLSLLLHVSR